MTFLGQRGEGVGGSPQKQRSKESIEIYNGLLQNAIPRDFEESTSAMKNVVTIIISICAPMYDCD